MASLEIVTQMIFLFPLLFILLPVFVASASETVGDKIFSTCTTASVTGLSLQLINGLNCLNPGLISEFNSNNIALAGAYTFPYLQTPAVNALETAANNGAPTQGTLVINSALRTLAQQYLLYKWAENNRCGISIAASPGNSSIHNFILF